MAETLNLEVVPAWEEIDSLREKTMAFFEGCGLDADAVHALSMVACELTENATKYGSWANSDERIEVALVFEPSAVTVEVKNPVSDEQSDDLERLDRMVQWIRGFQDPFEAYLERIKEVSAQSRDNEESGLGLVRIAYEGQSILDFYVSDRNVLAVSAVYPH